MEEVKGTAEDHAAGLVKRANRCAAGKSVGRFWRGRTDRQDRGRIRMTPYVRVSVHSSVT